MVLRPNLGGDSISPQGLTNFSLLEKFQEPSMLSFVIWLFGVYAVFQLQQCLQIWFP